MTDSSSQASWNKRWPSCLVGLDDLVKKLDVARSEATVDLAKVTIPWQFLVDSTLKMHDLLQGQQPPDSQPGDYEFGPVLPVIHYELPDNVIVDRLLDLLRWLGLPASPITKAQWEDDLQVLDSTGRVANDGSLVARSDLAVADYCWVIAFLKYLLLWIGVDSAHSFVKAPGPIPVPTQGQGSPSSITLAMAGDWGSGRWDDPGRVYPAEVVLGQMLTSGPQGGPPDFMIHLGDVYYAGTPKDSLLDRDEEGRYFTTQWRAGSRGALALNSNHEMYSGANGLFEALADPLFAAQKCSTYFAIEFGDWLVLGLDSAYYDKSFLFMDGALKDPDQRDFIKNLNPADKLVLVLTHHNPLVYTGESFVKEPKTKGEPPPTLWNDVCTALGKPPEVWYYGHLHNGIVYTSSSAAGKTLARCCGHGSLPIGNAYGLCDPSGNLLPTVAYYAHTPLPDPQVPPQTYRVLNGFATVELGGRSITERFYEQGIDAPVWEETTTF